MINIVFLVTGFMFILLLLLIFYSKKFIKTIENRYFRLLAIINLIGYLVELILQLSIRNLGPNEMLPLVVNRIYLSFYFIYFGIFTIYTFIISFNKNSGEIYKKRISIAKKIILSSIIIGSILVFILPQKIFYDGLKMYSYGVAVDVVKYGLFLYVFVCMMLLLLNTKHLNDKQLIQV